MSHISIFDSTLRDGAQAEGISFSVSDKIKITKALDDLGIDYIEAGNPGSNQKDLEYFKEMENVTLKHAKLVAFGSTRRCNSDVSKDNNVLALLKAKTPCVCIFGKSWDFHVEKIINTTLDENLAMILDTIKYLVSQGKEVMYDAEHYFDGFKHNKEYALKTLQAAKDAGAKCAILCDTNGGCFPDEIKEIVEETKQNIDIEIGIHTHNDMGLAISNSLMAVFGGATQVQGTFIGYGERTGNANLSAIMASLQLKRGYDCIPAESMKNLRATALLVAEISNIKLNHQLPYVGKSAFAHKAGMHIDGVQKASFSFEHIDPSLVGNGRRFLISEVAGRSTIIKKIEKYFPNINKSDKVIGDIVEKIKELEYYGYQFEGADGSFELLVYKQMGKYKPFFELEAFKTIGESPSNKGEFSASAIVNIIVNGENEITAANGDGPVNALDKALRKALDRFYPELRDVYLTDYKVRVLNSTDATASKVRVLMESTDGVTSWSTIGVSTDVLEASWKALVDSIEYKLIKLREEI